MLASPHSHPPNSFLLLSRRFPPPLKTSVFSSRRLRHSIVVVVIQPGSGFHGVRTGELLGRRRRSHFAGKSKRADGGRENRTGVGSSRFPSVAAAATGLFRPLRFNACSVAQSIFRKERSGGRGEGGFGYCVSDPLSRWDYRKGQGFRGS